MTRQVRHKSPTKFPPPSLAHSTIHTAQTTKTPLSKRCLWRTPRTRRTPPFHSKCNPSPSDARCPLARQQAARSRLYETSPPPSFLHMLSLQTMGVYIRTVILGLQQPSGVFAGDAFGETDTRFLYCAVSALSLLGALDRLDRERAVSYLTSCRNFDGGFGRIAGSESHAAQGMYVSLTPPPLYGLVRPLLKR
jgi:hypothetical protein